tara:strand:- start:987 stop:1361 length:375 start_codon:yes stop_codon:yes gene_type:complete
MLIIILLFSITQENLKVRQHINLFEKWSLFNRATLATPFRNLLQQRLKPQAEVEEIYAFMRDDEYSFVGDLPDIEYHRAELGDMETDARIRLAEEIGLPVDQIMHPGNFVIDSSSQLNIIRMSN